MAWTEPWPVAADSDIQINTFFDELDEAYQERAHLTTLCDIDPGPGRLHTEDDDIQYNLLPNLPSLVGSLPLYLTIRNFVIENYSAFLDMSLDYDAAGNNINTWASLSAFFTSIGLNANGFKKIRARHIETTSDTVDTDGDAIADGMLAQHDDGRVYERVAGVWVNRGPPGMVLPDRKTHYQNTVMIIPESEEYMTETGDFLNELRTALRALDWQFHRNYQVGFTFGGKNPTVVFIDEAQGKSGIQSGTEYSWAAAKASADSNYAASSTWISTDDWPYDRISTGYKVETGEEENPYSYEAFIGASRSKFLLDCVTNVQPGKTLSVSHTAEFYAYSAAPLIDPASSTPITHPVFDDDGDTERIQDEFNLVETIGPSAVDKTTDWIGLDPATPPAWTDEPMVADEYTSLGHTSLKLIGVILKYDVVGGFSKP